MYTRSDGLVSQMIQVILDTRKTRPFWFLAALLACASPLTYVRGPLPPAALPDPEIKISYRLRGEHESKLLFAMRGLDVYGESVELRGNLVSLARQKGAGHGLRMILEGVDGFTTVEMTLYKKIEGFDLKRDSFLVVKGTVGQGGGELEIRDDREVLFWLFAGSGRVVPEESLRVEVTSEVAYLETVTGDDLCVKTNAHYVARIEEENLVPGEQKVLCDEDSCKLFLVVDARKTIESNCDNQEPLTLILASWKASL